MMGCCANSGSSRLCERSLATPGNWYAQFGEKQFDIVHGQNCIDHTVNPLEAIRQMLAVTKPGGFVVLYHAENEGKNKSYKQLHKWDFTCESDHFLIRGPGASGGKVDVTEIWRLKAWLSAGWMTSCSCWKSRRPASD